MSNMSAGLAWLGFGLTVGTSSLVTYGLAVLPCVGAARRGEADPVCRHTRRTAVLMAALAVVALVVSGVLVFLEISDFP